MHENIFNNPQLNLLWIGFKKIYFIIIFILVISRYTKIWVTNFVSNSVSRLFDLLNNWHIHKFKLILIQFKKFLIVRLVFWIYKLQLQKRVLKLPIQIIKLRLKNLLIKKIYNVFINWIRKNKLLIISQKNLCL